MKNTLKIALLTVFLTGLSSASFAARFVNYDQNGEYAGLNEEGMQKMLELRSALMQRQQVFENNFRGLGSVHFAGTVARACKANMYLYGPPGGAKSAFVSFMFKGESDPCFQIQLNQMMTEQAIVGGQDFSEAQKGIFKLNTKGSLADFRVGLVDEAEKGNPAVLAALLNLLNERQVWAGGEKIDAKTETVFATSNANLPELFAMFVAGNQATTAPAFLNRFLIKAFVYNWLSQDDQSFLDKRRAKKRDLEVRAKLGDTSVVAHEVFLEPDAIDWDSLRLLAAAFIKTNASFDAAMISFIEEMRDETNLAVKASEDKNKASPREEPFVYFPSFDYTERARAQVLEVIYNSAMIDFLMSDFASESNIAMSTKKQIKVGPLSLWRTYLALTTVGPGETKLEIAEDGSVGMVFGFVDATKARDARELKLIQNLQEEQKRFARVFIKHMEQLRETIKDTIKNVRLAAPLSERMEDNFSAFEVMLLTK